ncbi:adenylate/guanylate cyclase domain-containing protein [Leptospira stimsonii]|uniref:Adenylate/guanylate cyclase domain-containing protein n=1 Tax=Leptospira stimsonii TaxID=2202203 RepID=A0ABY2ND71_9LEPT|nr:adenylate/guanylate cyclase domain-containing protein [Leptospira stimsonii]TGK20417.1 adenylate/guanylate cyclase domain-containing protein [Leptospira stimsonii]TGM21528.1 adenylate/guanylate cyclase domain-containing protein [Leptospira stimsonii]
MDKEPINPNDFEKQSILQKAKNWFGFVLEFTHILYLGIRAKLALFTGALIALTVFILSTIDVNQQTEILTQSYEKEAAISRHYISGLVLELENISSSLIRVESFRERVKRQSQALRKYRTKVVTQEEKQVSLFGFKTKLFGVLGKEKKSSVKDTYYSVYLSKDDIAELEKNTKYLLKDPNGLGISDSMYSKLLNMAQQVAVLEADLNEQKQKWDELGGKEGGTAKEKLPIEQKMELLKTGIEKARNQLDHSILELALPKQHRKIEELGLNMSQFRIQTFPVLSNQWKENLTPSFDTRIFKPDGPINGNEILPVVNANLKDSISKVLSLDFDMESDENAYRVGKMELQTLYSPIFRNQSSTERANTIRNKLPDFAKRYLQQDANIAKRVTELVGPLKKRISELKEKKPPVPPFKDKSFNDLYSKYSKLIQERETEFEKFRNEFSEDKKNQEAVAQKIKPGKTKSPKEKTFFPIQSDTDLLIDALGEIRNAGLEDLIVLRFSQNSGAYLDYLRDPKIQNLTKERWAAIREWIYSGKSETPTPQLKKLISDGIIANSRGEAEEILWSLDSKPLLSETSEEVSSNLLSANLSGISRTLVDRTEGLEMIRKNRNSAIATAMLICAIAILLAILISGFVVQKIKRIIFHAQEVGHGNLEVQFEQGGQDELGTLTVALNSMVSGLREREKIKNILGTMIDPVVVSEAMVDLAALKRGSEKRITAFFSDVAGFSNISEKLTSVELASLLNEYLSAMTIVLKKHEGVLDKYIGDAIVGIFNAPVEVENHCLKAARASVEMVERLDVLREEWKARKAYIQEAQEMTFRIGLNTGLAKVGFMGTDSISAYTMMGDTVNLAARLEAAGKDYGVNILIGESVQHEIKDEFFTRLLDVVRVKGKNEPVKLYELVGRHDKISERIEASALEFAKGFEAYLNREWSLAQEFLESSQITRGTKDKAAINLIERCEDYKLNPPEKTWDGVYTRTHK